MLLTDQTIREARERIAGKVNRTPVLTSRTFDKLAGGAIYFKCENFQKAGAFKSRGATNAVIALSDSQAAKGVATHSSGNHAAALARAAMLRGIPAYAIMPSNAPLAKQAAVARYGGRIIFCEPTLIGRERAAERVVSETGAELIHSYNNLHVVAGQGTAATEFLEEVPNLDMILCPVGGGGLLSGTAVAAKSSSSAIRVIGCEPEMANDAQQSLRRRQLIPQQQPQTIADGLRTSLGELTYSIVLQYVDDIVTVSEEEIVAAMRLTWEVLKIVIEPSSAVAVAAVLGRRVDMAEKAVGVILTGGNVDLDRLPWNNRPVGRESGRV